MGAKRVITIGDKYGRLTVLQDLGIGNRRGIL